MQQQQRFRVLRFCPRCGRIGGTGVVVGGDGVDRNGFVVVVVAGVSLGFLSLIGTLTVLWL